MATTIPLGGLAEAYVNGNQVMLVGSLTYQVSGIEYETQSGMDGVHGASGKNTAGFLSMKIRLTQDQNLSLFSGLIGATVTANLVNGTTITVTNGWMPKLPEGDAADGTADLRFESDIVTVD